MLTNVGRGHDPADPPPTTSHWDGSTMSDYENNDRFPNRKHPRMRHYDYSTPNYYFVTICTKDKACLFGSPEKLSDVGVVARDSLLDIPIHFPGVVVDQYVVMPNHVHAIIALQDHNTNLSILIGQYKSSVTRKIRRIHPGMDVWQSSFHDHVIRNQSSYDKIWLYIEGNPAKWEEDCFYIPAAASD